MRRVWSLIAVLLFSGFGLIATPSAACACSCVGGSDPFVNAEQVFIGVATEVREGQATFTVEETLKGRVGETVTLEVPTGGEAGCEFHFSQGQRYQVNASGGRTSLCSGNRLLGVDNLLPDGPSPLGVLVVGAATLLAGGALYVLRRRFGDRQL